MFGIDFEEIGAFADRDGADYGILFGIYDGYGTVALSVASVDYVNFVARGMIAYAGWILPYLDLPIKAHVDNVDHADCITSAVGYIGKLPVVCGIFGEIMRLASHERQDGCTQAGEYKCTAYAWFVPALPVILFRGRSSVQAMVAPT